jgi:hypothetical protein
MKTCTHCARGNATLTELAVVEKRTQNRRTLHLCQRCLTLDDASWHFRYRVLRAPMTEQPST